MSLERKLQDAILLGDLGQVEKILADRNEHGIPRVNLNAGYNLNHDIKGAPFVEGTALMLAIQTHKIPDIDTVKTRSRKYISSIANDKAFEPRAAIFQMLLDLRDKANNPVIEVNKQFGNDNTIVHQVIKSHHLSVGQAMNLLQRLLDFRPHGNLAVNLKTPDGTSSLLTFALRRNCPQLLRMLLDVYDENGDPVLDINQYNKNEDTLLDIAERRKWTHKVSEIVLNTIREAGGLTWFYKEAAKIRADCAELRAQLNVMQMLPPAGGEGVHNFVRNSQNTHETEVTVSVRASIKRLKKRYVEALKHEITILDKIETYLNNLPNSDQKPHVIAAFNRIKTNTDVSTSSEVTLKEALTLVWLGIEDEKALTGEGEALTEEDIVSRKNELVNNLYKTQTGRITQNGLMPLCFVGTLNKIIETLDGIHPDVLILTGRSAIKETLGNRVLNIVREEFEKKSVTEQKAIFRTWNEESGDATEFKTKLETWVDEQLKEEYQTLLTEEERRVFTSNFDDILPIPKIPHKQLDQLVETIKLLPDFLDSISELKKQSKNIFDDNNQTFEEEYQNLLEKFTALQDSLPNYLPKAKQHISAIFEQLKSDSSFNKTRILMESTVQKMELVLNNIPVKLGSTVKIFEDQEVVQFFVLNNVLEKMDNFLCNRTLTNKTQLISTIKDATVLFPETDPDLNKQILGGLLAAVGAILCATVIFIPLGSLAFRQAYSFFKEAENTKNNLLEIAEEYNTNTDLVSTNSS